MGDYWTTAKGERIAYEDLTDSHLKNIIKDGYRNKNRRIMELSVKRFNVDGEIVYKKYKCLNCEYKGKKYLNYRAYWND